MVDLNDLVELGRLRLKTWSTSDFSVANISIIHIYTWYQVRAALRRDMSVFRVLHVDSYMSYEHVYRTGENSIPARVRI